MCARVAIEGVAVRSQDVMLSTIYGTTNTAIHLCAGVCTWPWAGGSSNCNIHNPNGPHCPWCESPKTHTQFLVDDRVMGYVDGLGLYVSEVPCSATKAKFVREKKLVTSTS